MPPVQFCVPYAGNLIGSHTRFKPGVAAGIVLSVDVPSPTTGTGDALITDGADSALIRATVVDATGHETLHSGANISFEIVTGPGRVIGVGNGDPTCTEPNGARCAHNHTTSRCFARTYSTYDCQCNVHSGNLKSMLLGCK